MKSEKKEETVTDEGTAEATYDETVTESNYHINDVEFTSNYTSKCLIILPK